MKNLNRNRVAKHRVRRELEIIGNKRFDPRSGPLHRLPYLYAKTEPPLTLIFHSTVMIYKYY